MEDKFLNKENGKFCRLPNIRVPLDAYKFVAALDRLIGQLPVEKPTNSGLQKITDHSGTEH
jgi:hypothetical protein